ncbi:UDP-N-acetylglucosamine--peptide N-acetylglucosaminyltransferase 110 kDa subunit [Durusdinium trenchii]|uniref:UDP-N-acetylglucosamine--peptide N-acetylglucosaminyltransferase 110 kDa subunit n=1 Tax=Durusdinium trenchii TaxID=1381693 RepID=A0ABP0P8A0_9DINO
MGCGASAGGAGGAGGKYTTARSSTSLSPEEPKGSPKGKAKAKAKVKAKAKKKAFEAKDVEWHLKNCQDNQFELVKTLREAYPFDESKKKTVHKREQVRSGGMDDLLKADNWGKVEINDIGPTRLLCDVCGVLMVDLYTHPENPFYVCRNCQRAGRKLELCVSCYKNRKHEKAHRRFASLRRSTWLMSHGKRLMSMMGFFGFYYCAAEEQKDVKSKTSSPRSLQRLFKQALKFSDQGHNDQALLVYQTITQSYPECPEAWLNLGICHAAEGSDENLQLALQGFDQALHLDDTYHDAHYNKALVLDDLGLTSEALESFKSAEDSALGAGARRAAAAYAEAAGFVWAAEGYAEEALEAYERAIQLEGGDGGLDARVNRGEVLCDLGRFREALQSHQEALELLERNELGAEMQGLRCGILYNVASTYAAMGDEVSCMKSLEAAMEVDHMQVMAILFNFKGGGSLLSERRMQEEAFLKKLEDTADELVQVLRALRALEEDPRWIWARLMESASSKGTAYGTTWTESWFSFAEKAQLAVSERDGERKMVVLGSSLGWQCFLGLLHLNYTSCVGYEILPSQVEEAQHLAQSWSLNITFHCQDALEANLEDAELVWLNSYAWPSEVKQLLSEKLAELPRGARVVSYEAFPEAAPSGAWRLEAQEPLETSWDSELLAYVYQRQ